VKLLLGSQLALLLAPVGAQDPAGVPPVIDPERVTEIISMLASDELGGRDTPSPGLELAAEFIGEQFRKASLEPLGDGQGYFHRYSLPGMALDSTALQVTLHVGEGTDAVDRVLIPDRDVRIWIAGGPYRAERTEVLVSATEQADGQRAWMRSAGQRPRFLVVAGEDALWQAAAGVRRVLEGRRVGGTPVLLLRQEVVPDAPFTATIDMPAPQAVEIPLRNPIGILPGATRPEEFVLVSAHYDHLGIGTPVNGDSIYNGADDDASGTTAVVVLAEALAKSGPRPARSIAFICFSGEEKGLRGSRAFAEDPPIALENVVANVNIEMIGRPRADDRMAAWITGADLSDFAEIAGPALMRAEVRLVGFEMADRLFDRSDNASLARKGVVAHSISAGTPHRDYHQPSDEVDKIDLQHMTAVIAGLAEVVLEFAQRDERPAYNERGKARLQGGRRP
jgi:hypothetical protein